MKCRTHDPLTAIVAYEHNNQPLNETEEGNLRVVVVSPKNNQVVDGHWSVKWVNMVEAKTVGQTWTLDLTGAIPVACHPRFIPIMCSTQLPWGELGG